MESKVEAWRKEMGYTYQGLADIMGCSKQYARNLCLHGTAGVVKALKLLSLANGALELEDFLGEEEREELIRDGFLEASDTDI